MLFQPRHPDRRRGDHPGQASLSLSSLPETSSNEAQTLADMESVDRLNRFRQARLVIYVLARARVDLLICSPCIAITQLTGPIELAVLA